MKFLKVWNESGAFLASDLYTNRDCLSQKPIIPLFTIITELTNGTAVELEVPLSVLFPKLCLSFSREVCLVVSPLSQSVFSPSPWEVFPSTKVFLEGHKNRCGKAQLDHVPKPLRIDTGGTETLRRLTSNLEVRRWVPACLVFQYQGGLRALRKLKQLQERDSHGFEGLFHWNSCLAAIWVERWEFFSWHSA